jgi:hypothetical protein
MKSYPVLLGCGFKGKLVALTGIEPAKRSLSSPLQPVSNSFHTSALSIVDHSWHVFLRACYLRTAKSVRLAA